MRDQYEAPGDQSGSWASRQGCQMSGRGHRPSQCISLNYPGQPLTTSRESLESLESLESVAQLELVAEQSDIRPPLEYRVWPERAEPAAVGVAVDSLLKPQVPP